MVKNAKPKKLSAKELLEKEKFNELEKILKEIGIPNKIDTLKEEVTVSINSLDATNSSVSEAFSRIKNDLAKNNNDPTTTTAAFINTHLPNHNDIDSIFTKTEESIKTITNLLKSYNKEKILKGFNINNNIDIDNLKNEIQNNLNSIKQYANTDLTNIIAGIKEQPITTYLTQKIKDNILDELDKLKLKLENFSTNTLNHLGEFTNDITSKLFRINNLTIKISVANPTIENSKILEEITEKLKKLNEIQEVINPAKINPFMSTFLIIIIIIATAAVFITIFIAVKNRSSLGSNKQQQSDGNGNDSWATNFDGLFGSKSNPTTSSNPSKN